MAETDIPPATPAASLIVMRPARGGPAEILFCERARALRFGGGAIVFPGGRVDPADEALAARYPHLAPADAAARIAALRETQEETGVAIGFDPQGRGFHEKIAASPPDLAMLAPFARWRPPAGFARRFDARFYVVEAPPGVDAVADGGETAQVFWATAAAMAERVREGTAQALFPTRRLLDRLALFGDARAAAADRHAGVERAIVPFVERRDDGDWLRIPADAGYPITEERIAPGLRG